MKIEIFEKEKLPLRDFENVGLAYNGQILLEKEDLQAILAGRRTNLIRLHNLSANGLFIKELDSKLSVIRGKAGHLELLFHPLYKKPVHSAYLTPEEVEYLQSGTASRVIKTVQNGSEGPANLLIEFDKENKEFVVTDIRKIVVPEVLDMEHLNQEQKALFRQGLEVQTRDGSRFIFSAIQETGVMSVLSNQRLDPDYVVNVPRSGPSR